MTRQLVPDHELRELDGLACRVTLSTRRVDSLQHAGPFFFGGIMTVNIRGYNTEIDEESLPIIRDKKWRPLKGTNGRVYFQHTLSSGKSIYLHRVIVGSKKGEQVDHVDMNTLNNRMENLRIATAAQNQFNRGRPRNNTSGFKGVSWCESSGRWQAFIKRGGKSVWIGSFLTPEEAHEAYKLAVIEIAGEFARW